MNSTDNSAEANIRSPNNPVGLYKEILDPSFPDRVTDYYRRISIVAADLSIYLTDVVKIDEEMAEIVSARAVRAMLAATAITLEPHELDAIFAESKRLIGLDDKNGK